jgi:uncharacterized protein YgbK (DUF1537 family)
VRIERESVRPAAAWAEALQENGGDTVRGLILTPAWTDEAQRGPSDPAFVARLADVAAAVVRRGAFTRVVVGGGSTAEALLERLGVLELEVEALAGVGMPLLRVTSAVAGDGQPTSWPHFVLKAGTHGDDQQLVRWLHDGRA